MEMSYQEKFHLNFLHYKIYRDCMNNIIIIINQLIIFRELQSNQLSGTIPVEFSVLSPNLVYL